MKDAQSSDAVECFGAFEVDFQSRRLRKHGMRIRLEEQPFQILEMLLDRAGQVATRKSLREKLWPNTLVGYRFIAPVTKLQRASSPAGKKMLMALPFENLSDSRERDYLADGLTEEMISQLGKLDPKR